MLNYDMYVRTKTTKPIMSWMLRNYSFETEKKYLMHQVLGEIGSAKLNDNTEYSLAAYVESPLSTSSTMTQIESSLPTLQGASEQIAFLCYKRPGDKYIQTPHRPLLDTRAHLYVS